MFLTNLYKDYLNEIGQTKITTAIPEIIPFCARNRYDILFIHAFILNKYYLLVVIAQYECFACVFQFVISKVIRFGSAICQLE